MTPDFEKWATNRAHGALDLTKNKDGYVSDETDAAWEGYRAALSHQGDVVKVSELQTLCEDWRKNATSAFTLGCADELTALISKAEKV